MCAIHVSDFLLAACLLTYGGVRIELALHVRNFFQLMMRISLPAWVEDDVEFPVKQSPRESNEQWLKAET